MQYFVFLEEGHRKSDHLSGFRKCFINLNCPTIGSHTLTQKNQNHSRSSESTYRIVHRRISSTDSELRTTYCSFDDRVGFSIQTYWLLQFLMKPLVYCFLSTKFTPFKFCIFLFQFLWREFLHVHSDCASYLPLFLLHQQSLACSPVPGTVWWHLLCSSIWPDTHGCLGPTCFTSNCLSRSKQGKYNVNTTICVCDNKTNSQGKQPSVV